MERMEDELEKDLLSWEQNKGWSKAKEQRKKVTITTSKVRERDPVLGRGEKPPTKKKRYKILGEEWGAEGRTESSPPHYTAENAPPVEALRRGKQSSLFDYYIKNEREPPPLAGADIEAGATQPTTTPPPKVPEVCIIDKKVGKCATHNCEVRCLRIPTTKWAWIEKSKKFGNVRKLQLDGSAGKRILHMKYPIFLLS